MKRMVLRPSHRRALFAAITVLSCATPVEAYVGPGAGFALLTSFLTLLTTLIVALSSILVLPFRMAMRVLRRRRRSKPLVRRLIIIGLDGLDPKLAERYISEGKLPNLSRLAASGGYRRLATTFPAVSPVAWSTFSTGVNPARHNVFDFIDRDLRTYLPVLSSARILAPERALTFGRVRIPLERPRFRLLRKSRPFWTILGEHDIWSTVLRVPITFPAEKFYGAELSGMCVPDLLGTQGTFAVLSTRRQQAEVGAGGVWIELARRGHVIEGRLPGPPNSLLWDEPRMFAPISIRPEGSGRALVTVDGQRHWLDVGSLSDWMTVTFHAAPFVKVRGICRMVLLEVGEHVSLYVTPMNIDPEKPVMPLSHPPFYATYLAKKIGPFATLGLAEDTSALNEGVIDEKTFLQQTYEIDAERERMLTVGLDTLQRGCLVCVFDATDRIQHMFWRYLDPAHPAQHGRQTSAHADVIEELYRHNDALVGRVMARLTDGDVLMVLSDHGFNAFRRGVNLNAWLHANGYLALRPEADGSSPWLRDVDWSRTRAYALGLTGLFLNLKGRESQGIVRPGDEARQLKQELVSRLSGLIDPETDDVAVTEAFESSAVYGGPYLENSPDLIIGYNAGYRVSWGGATGVVQEPIFTDNLKAWSGDHCIDPKLVPGVLFCSEPIAGSEAALIDIAPTVLHLFGIAPPHYMEGKILIDNIPGPLRVTA